MFTDGSLINGDDYDEDFQSSSSSSISKKGDVNENSMNNPPISVEEELDVSTSDLLKSQSSNGGNDTMDKSTSNSNLASAEYVENLRKWAVNVIPPNEILFCNDAMNKKKTIFV